MNINPKFPDEQKAPGTLPRSIYEAIPLSSFWGYSSWHDFNGTAQGLAFFSIGLRFVSS